MLLRIELYTSRKGISGYYWQNSLRAERTNVGLALQEQKESHFYVIKHP